MKHMKTVEVPATTKSFVDKVTCDLCGREIEKPGSYCIDDITVYRRKGKGYPEGGWGTETTFDVCGECFETQIIPIFENRGVEKHTVEWDY
jgi:hypothetical protein